MFDFHVACAYAFVCMRRLMDRKGTEGKDNEQRKVIDGFEGEKGGLRYVEVIQSDCK